MGKKITLILGFTIFISIIPFPEIISDFQFQKGILLLILIFCLIPFVVYTNKALISLLMIVYAMITCSIVLNIYRLDNVYDISSEIARYIILFMILNCVIYYTKGLNTKDIYIINKCNRFGCFLLSVYNIAPC